MEADKKAGVLKRGGWYKKPKGKRTRLTITADDLDINAEDM